jgi:hypothetical protein
MKTKSILLLFFVTCLFSCNINQNQTAEYKFEISGTFGSKPAFVGSDLMFSNVVLFNDADGNNHKWDNVVKGWTYTWKQKGIRFININVTNTSNEGDITIKVFRNNELIATNTGYGGSFAAILGNY